MRFERVEATVSCVQQALTFANADGCSKAVDGLAKGDAAFAQPTIVLVSFDSELSRC